MVASGYITVLDVLHLYIRNMQYIPLPNLAACLMTGIHAFGQGRTPEEL